MTLIVQDDTGFVGGANAYIDYVFFLDYFNSRNTTANANATDGTYEQTTTEAAIVVATDYVDKRFTFVGRRKSRDQTTEWPRLNAFDRDRYLVTNVPIGVKQACAEYAFRVLQLGSLITDPVRDDTGTPVASITQTVGPISETKSFVGSNPTGSFTLPHYPSADILITGRGLTSTSASGTFELRRA
jgi:hypothetical protein